MRLPAAAPRLGPGPPRGRRSRPGREGATAHRRSNECLHDAVDAYLLHGTLPAEGTTC
ncbi:alpha/beta hydrolase [Geodermatophilus africanus]|uniref:alpha/beta hydrolase n=1 Tax=Geodermatophilus africanus TaxID=1137993 RepID=UPI000B873AA9